MNVLAFALVFLSISHSTWSLILEPVFIVHLFQKYLFLLPPICSPPNGLSLSFASSWSNIPHLLLSQAEKQRLEEALNAAQEEEGSLAAAKRALEARLEEAQRGLTRLGQEQQALNQALEEEGKQREVLRRSKAELEEQKRLLDRTVDRLNKEVGTGWPRLRKRLSSYRSLPGAVDRGGNGVTACGVCFPQVHCWGSQGQRGRVASFLCPLSVLAHPCHPIPLRSNPWRPSVSWSSF